MKVESREHSRTEKEKSIGIKFQSMPNKKWNFFSVKVISKRREGGTNECCIFIFQRLVYIQTLPVTLFITNDQFRNRQQSTFFMFTNSEKDFP